MNIFVCTHGPASGVVGASRVWQVAFVDTLRSMGHRVFEASFDWLSAFVPVLNPSLTREMRSESLLAEVQRIHDDKGIDLFLSYFYDQHVDAEAIRLIGKLGIPTVNFFCDNIRLPKGIEQIKRAFTLNWVPEWEAVSVYQKLKIPHIYLPMAANPSLYRPMAPLKERELVFVGGADPERYALVASLLRSGVAIEVFGFGWLSDEPKENDCLAQGYSENHSNRSSKFSLNKLARIGRVVTNQYELIQEFGVYGLYRKVQNMYLVHRHAPETKQCYRGGVTDQQMVRLYSEGKVTLGINRLFEIAFPRAKVKYSKIRDFEAPMAGACYLTEHCTDLEKNYEIGKEVWTYDSEDDLIDKSKELLSHYKLRAELKAAARKAALERHTWTHRFESLFTTLSLA